MGDFSGVSQHSRLYNGWKAMRGFAHKVVRILGSRRFFYGVMIFFALESLWIALSARYPMVFDEEFHLGVIKVYSHNIVPFLPGQPDGANAFGSLATDPSYLYHYLMSFPYRLIAVFTGNLTAQVILLRCINIAIFAAGIWLFRRLLIRSGTSPALTHTAVALFVLIPIVPLMAGQVNYDSLLLVILAWTCLLVLSIITALRQRKLPLQQIGLLAIACMLGSLAKYAFLPVAIVAAAYVAVMIWVAFRGRGAQLSAAIHKSYRLLGGAAKAVLVVGLLVSAGLFVQRYGSNIVTYHNPVPDCDAVIGVDACLDYGPWARNYSYASEPLVFNHSPIAYTGIWLQSMHYRLFFMVNGPPNYTSYPPSPLPSAAFIVVALSGTIALLLYARRVFAGRPYLIFLLAMTLAYVGILWVQNYSDYLDTTRPVAINGRYLVPFLLPMVAVLGRSLSIALARWTNVKAGAAVLVIVCFMQGGGTLGFISRSDASWYWQNQTVVRTNQTAQRVINAITFEGPKYY